MSPFCCYCERAFDWHNKLRRHLALTNCLVNIAKDWAAKLRKRKRGIGKDPWETGQKNVKRDIRRRIPTFVKYLKHNIRRQGGHIDLFFSTRFPLADGECSCLKAGEGFLLAFCMMPRGALSACERSAFCLRPSGRPLAGRASGLLSSACPQLNGRSSMRRA